MKSLIDPDGAVDKMNLKDAEQAFEEGMVGENPESKVGKIRAAFSKCITILIQLEKEGEVEITDNLPTPEEVLEYNFYQLDNLTNYFREVYFIDEEEFSRNLGTAFYS